jgi:glycosyltransferase involved in cell wall biosynthesis
MGIRILYDISVLGMSLLNPAGRTGIFRVVEHVAEGLARSSGIELYFCSTYGFIQKRPNAIELCKKYLAKNPHFNHIPFFVKNFPKVDIFHSPFHPIPLEIEGPLRILTVYDLIPLLYPKYIPLPNILLQRLAFHLLKPEDHLISISSATQKDLWRLTGIEHARSHVTYLAADRNYFYPCTDGDRILEVRRKYGIQDVPYVLSLCTLEPRKNLDHIIRVFSKLVYEGKAEKTKLVLVGATGWDYGRIFKEIKADPVLRTRIVTTGYVPDKELSPLYSGAAVFVYMSIYEGFGLPPLEAMQCGTPVITSNTSSLPEVVGNAGVQLAPGDTDGLAAALTYVLQDPELRRNMSNKSLRQASLFSWDKCVGQTVGVYQKILNLSEPALEAV